MAGVTTTNSQQANAAFEEITTALQEQSTKLTGNSSGSLSGQQTASRYSDRAGIQRTPWIMSTTEWLMRSPPIGILWAANPSDISWTMGLRTTHVKNLFGTVMHVWPDDIRRTHFDEFRLNLNLQSGNIMPIYLSAKNEAAGGYNVSGITDVSKWEPAPGLANFYDLMLLLDAPKLVANDGRVNMVSIQYSSNLFPKLTLFGMFDSSGIKFTDTSQEPNKVSSWNVDFIVYDTFPRLSDFSGRTASNSQLLQDWLETRIPNITGGNPPKTLT